MSIPGLESALNLPIAVRPDYLSTSITDTGVTYTIDPPSKAKTYCLIAEPVDPTNLNLLLWSDIPTNSNWLTSNVSVATGVTDPLGGANAWSATAGNSAVSDNVRQVFTSNRYETWQAGPVTNHGMPFCARIWCKAGGSDAEDEDLGIVLQKDSDSNWQDVGWVQKISGAGAIVINSNLVNITGLSETVWSEFEILWMDETVVYGDDYRIHFYPGGRVQNSGVTHLFRPQVQYAETYNPLTGLFTTDVRMTEDKNGPDGAPGGAVPLYLSNNGYASFPEDEISNRLFKASLEVPYQISVDLGSGDTFDGVASVNAGTIEIINHDGFFDDYLDYSWSQRSIEIYQGEWDQRFDDFDMIFKGMAEDISWSEDMISVQLRDSTQKLNRLLQETMYGGFDQCLRGSGSAEMFQCSRHPSGWMHGNLTVSGRFRFVGTPANNVGTLVLFRGSGSTEAENAAYRIYHDKVNTRLVFGWQYGSTPAWEQWGTDTGSVPATWYTDNEWHTFSAVRDVVTQNAYLYIDGTEYLLSEGYSNPPSGGEAGYLTVGSASGGGTNQCDFDVDDVRIYEVAKTAAELEAGSDSIVSPTSENLRLYYRMDEGYGTTTYEETVLLGENAQIMDAVLFTGSSSHGIVTDDPDLGPHTSFTIECTFYPGPYNSGKNYYYWKNLSYRMYHDSTADKLYFSLYDTTGATWRDIEICTGYTWSLGDRWYRVAVVWDDATQTVRSFVDGTLISTYQNPDIGINDWTAGDGGGASLRFGYNGTSYYQNWIADWRYWSGAVADAAIEDWYNVYLSSAHPNWSANLKAWYRFSEGTGTEVENDAPGDPVGDISLTSPTWVSTDGTLDATNPASWVGTGEGSPSLSGYPKPIAVGRSEKTEMILVDPIHNVHQVADGSIEEVEAVEEGGVELQASTLSGDIWDYSFAATALDKFFMYNGSTYSDDTTEANESAAHDGLLELTDATPAVGDAIYVGMVAGGFGGVDFWMHTASPVGTPTVWVGEYWDGSAWSSLPGFRDYSDNFTKLLSYVAYDSTDQAGGGEGQELTGTDKDRTALRWSIPGDWAVTQVSDAVDRYYVRFRLTAEPPSTQIRASAAWVIAGDYVADESRGLIRMQSQPFYPLTASIKGDNNGGYVEEPGPVMKRLATRWGGMTTAETFHTLDDFGEGVTVGLSTGTRRTRLADVLTTVASSVHGQPYMTKGGYLAAVQIPIPDPAEATGWSSHLIIPKMVPPTGEEVPFELTPEIYEFESLRRSSVAIPCWRYSVGYAPYWRPLRDSEVNKGRVQRSSDIDDLQLPYRLIKETLIGNKDVWLGSPDRRMDTLLYESSDAADEAKTRMALYGKRRHLYELSIAFGSGFAYDLGVKAILKTNGRFNISDDNGKFVIVVGFDEDPTEELVTFRLWG